MCGRLACGLQPEEVCNSCCYKKKGSETFSRPQWKYFTDPKKTYKPSYNICPSEIAPVLLSGSHFNSSSRMIAPMVFGLNPAWRKTRSSHLVINCRLENINTAKIFRTSLMNRQRCVVICNGFYEWLRKNKNSSTPFFMYCEQPKGMLVDDPYTWNLKHTIGVGLENIKVLKMAALFHKQSFKNKEPIYSFTIITKEASSKMAWLHPRMPVLVNTEEQLDVWLNSDEYDTNQALANLSQDENIICYPVSNLVNKIGNKDISCIKQNKESEKYGENGANILKAWLQGQKRKADPEGQESPPPKKKMKLCDFYETWCDSRILSAVY